MSSTLEFSPSTAAIFFRSSSGYEQQSYKYIIVICTIITCIHTIVTYIYTCGYVIIHIHVQVHSLIYIHIISIFNCTYTNTHKRTNTRATRYCTSGIFLSLGGSSGGGGLESSMGVAFKSACTSNEYNFISDSLFVLR